MNNSPEIAAAATGIAVAIAVIILFSGPASAADCSDEKSVAVSNVTELESDENCDQSTPELSEAEVLERTKKLRATFNISEGDVRKAIQKTKEDRDNGIERDDSSPLNVVKIVEWIIFLSIIAGLVYILNQYSHGEALARLCGIFPRECKTLGYRYGMM